MYRSGGNACVSIDLDVYCSGDHAEVIQRALNQRGVVFIRKGDYFLNRTLDVYSMTMIIGEGDRSTNLVRNVDVPVLRAYTTGDPYFNIHVSNLRIYDNVGGSSEIIYFYNVKDSSISRITLSGFRGNGIRITGGGAGYSFWNIIYDVLLEGRSAVAGIKLEPSSPDLFISHVTGGGVGVGIDVYSFGVYIDYVWVVNADHEIRLNSVKNIIMNNITFDYCKISCIEIVGNCDGIVLNNAHVSGTYESVEYIRINVASGQTARNIIIRNLTSGGSRPHSSIVSKVGAGSVEKLLVDGIVIPPYTTPGYTRYKGITIDGVNIRVVNDFYM